MKLRTLRPRVPTLAGNRIPGSSKGKGQGPYTYRWKMARLRFLSAHPLCQCEDCDEGRKRVTPSQVVDHRVPHRGDLELFWRESNWQAMAKECHDRKTASMDGGFGNAPSTKACAPKVAIGLDGYPLK